MTYNAAEQAARSRPPARTRSSTARPTSPATSRRRRPSTFTIGTPTGDATAPVTTGTLDPAQPGPGRTYAGPVTVNLSALDRARRREQRRRRRQRHALDAVGGEPERRATRSRGASARPRAARTTCGSSRRAATRARPARTSSRSPTIVFPGGAPVSRTLTQTGTWTFLCRLHAAFTGGAWNGMVGTAAVAAGSGSGVDFTEYRVDGGGWVRRREHGGRQPVRVAGDGLGRGPAHGRVPLGGQGRQRRGDEVGRVRHRRRPSRASR